MSIFKSGLAASLLVASLGASATVSVPVTPVALINQGGGILTGGYTGNASVNDFSLDLSAYTGLAGVTSVLQSISFGGIGFEITSATFDGVSFTPEFHGSGLDLWTFTEATPTSTVHTLQIFGIDLGGPTDHFEGNITTSLEAIPIPSVPEPANFALLLSGLGLTGVLAVRRKRSEAAGS